MDFSWSDKEQTFRDRVQTFLREEWGDAEFGELTGRERSRAFERRLAEEGGG